MSAPCISVVVPFYNNGDVLNDCLQSIASQTHRNLQVIMVDDGSTDGGPGIATKWAAADPRFSLIRTPNGGPGKARNVGIERANGEYLAFVDGDDMLAPYAYEVLLHTLESSGSDFVSGAVSRIGTRGVHPSALHARAIKGRKIRTHVTRSPELLYDISVWNKLFRKSFWDAHGLYYPEGVVWEDLQLMTRAHVLATAVDVIGDEIYYWRERAAGDLSITQNRTDIQNLRDRITAFRAIDAFLREHARPRLLRQHQRKALVNDLWLYVRDLRRVGEDYLREYLGLVGSYLGTVSGRVFRTLPATHKLAYYLTRKRQAGPLIEYLNWLHSQPVTTMPVIRRFGTLRTDLPFSRDKTLNIPRWVYRPHWRDLDPFVQVESVQWQRGNLVIAGLAYVPSIHISKRRHTSKIIVLRPRRLLRPPVVSVATSYRHPRATVLSGQDRYDYTWAGFRCEISSRWFRIAGRWLTGDWDCFILVRARGVWRPARLHTWALGDAGRPEPYEPAPGLQVRPTWVGRHLHVGVMRTPARLAGFGLGEEYLDLRVTVEMPATGAERTPTAAEFVLARQAGRQVQAFPATLTGESARTWRATGKIPVSALPAGADDPGTAPGPTAASGTYWDLYLKLTGHGRYKVTFPRSVSEGRRGLGEREIAVERSRDGDATVCERQPQPVISEHRWTPAGQLLLTGTYPGPPAHPLTLVLRRRGGTDEHVIACQRDGQQFSARADVGAMPRFGELLPLHDGHWQIMARPGGESSEPLVPVVCDHTRLREISHKKVAVGRKLYSFTTFGYDMPMITAEPQLRLSEQGRFNRRVLRHAFYPIQSHRPLRDAVLFVSWRGKQCGDNPRGIAEELRRHGDGREQIWVVTDYASPVPAGGRAVLSGTEEYFEALSRCRYVISNDDMHAEYRKRDGQIYLQTWHGTPLKRIGFDVERPQFASGTAYLAHLAEEVPKWDLLLSQNSFSTPIFRRAFRFGGEVCEYGYPRNDILARGDERAAEVRRSLGIPAGKRVILYAPTWRDNQFYASGRYRFDLRLDLEAAWGELGRDHVILIRGHHHSARDVQVGGHPGFAVNVTAYPSIADLFLISDILVTDYSSVMFDFAVTRRPMIFFTYDLETYRDQLRGFYFDFEAEAPGPLLATSGEVITALRETSSVPAGHRAAYEAFAAKYCPLDDGRAGARVCERLFAR